MHACMHVNTKTDFKDDVHADGAKPFISFEQLVWVAGSFYVSLSALLQERYNAARAGVIPSHGF